MGDSSIFDITALSPADAADTKLMAAVTALINDV
jgi:hypothetical protein